ncbi:MAG: hypothetical protein DMG35_20345 [Acidobacteria bacterium]|nr:MAG: hypothetical protein DMG35_20345 [Acidobacteriota bacterium]
MTRLRKMMLEELQRRNYAETTIDCYIHAVEDFSRHFHCSPDRLGPRHIREYQAELFQKRKFSPNTVAQRLAALRFFYVKTLKKAWSITETPYPKKAVYLPTILSQEEVARLIDAARPPLHRTLLMALYATGLRRAELARGAANWNKPTTTSRSASGCRSSPARLNFGWRARRAWHRGAVNDTSNAPSISRQNSVEGLSATWT